MTRVNGHEGGCQQRGYYASLAEAYDALVGTEDLEKVAGRISSTADALVKMDVTAADLGRAGLQREYQAALLLALLMKRHPQVLNAASFSANLAEGIRRITQLSSETGAQSSSVQVGLSEFFEATDEDSAKKRRDMNLLSGEVMKDVRFDHRHGDGTPAFTVDLLPPSRRGPVNERLPAFDRQPTVRLAKVEGRWIVSISTLGRGDLAANRRHDLSMLSGAELTFLRKTLARRLVELANQPKPRDGLLGELLTQSRPIQAEKKVVEDLLAAVTATLQKRIDEAVARDEKLEVALAGLLKDTRVREVPSVHLEGLIARLGIVPLPDRRTVEAGDDRTAAVIEAFEAVKQTAIEQGYGELRFEKTGLEAGGATRSSSDAIGAGDLLDVYGQGEKGTRHLGTLFVGHKTAQSLKEDLLQLMRAIELRSTGSEEHTPALDGPHRTSVAPAR